MAARNWGYQNGKIPLSAGVTVRGELFQPDAAAALVLLEHAYAKKFGAECPIVQGYRPLGVPTDPANASGSTQFTAWNYYTLDTRNHPVAARPILVNGVWVGTSGHGTMTSADLGGRAGLFNTVEHQWVVDNAPRFGWAWGGTPSEAWHIDYVGPITVTATSIAAGGAHLLIPTAPRPLTQEEIDDMSANQNAAIINDFQRNRTALLYPDGRVVGIASSDDKNSLVTAHIRVYNMPKVNADGKTDLEVYGSQLTAAQWDAWIAKYPGAKAL